tara:strand:- start:392 stop:916 length:525 start_codon:yes stop_codon:yes gene_type:complete
MAEIKLLKVYDAFKETNAPQETAISPSGREITFYPDWVYSADYMIKSDDTNRLLRWVYQLSDKKKVSVQGYLKAVHPKLARKVTSGKNALSNVWDKLSDQEKHNLVDSIPWNEIFKENEEPKNSYRLLERWLIKEKHPLANVGQAETYLMYGIIDHFKKKKNNTSRNKIFRASM